MTCNGLLRAANPKKRGVKNKIGVATIKLFPLFESSISFESSTGCVNNESITKPIYEDACKDDAGPPIFVTHAKRLNEARLVPFNFLSSFY